MKHLALLASVYALIALLVLPGSILAQEDAAPPAETQTAPAEQAAPPAEPAPAETAPAPAPEPQFLADERDEAPEPAPQAVAAASGSVTVSDFSFGPGTITINQGDTVTWVNNGPTPHSATSSSGVFDTGIFPKGQSRSHTFNEAGTFAYICTPHPFMKGTVVVQASQTEGSGGSGSGDTGGAAGTGGTGATAAQDQGPTLPNSGADAGALLILGGLMLLLGIAVRRRAAEPG
jgi:plastocyanin